jgi:hypothetical protein
MQSRRLFLRVLVQLQSLVFGSAIAQPLSQQPAGDSRHKDEQGG